MARVQIAVTGGTGHLGCCLIQNLLKNGYFVIALYHNSIPEFEHSNLSWIQGNVIDSVSVDLLVDKATVIIHCASVISIGNHDDKEVYRINVDLGFCNLFKHQHKPLFPLSWFCPVWMSAEEC